MPRIPHLWSHGGILPPSWQARLRRARRVLAASDFDGTLAEIVAAPELAFPARGARAALARLARRPGWAVAVVSGRELQNLRRHCGIPGIWYIGSHGNQIAPPRGRRLNLPAPSACLDEAVREEVRRRIRAWPGVLLENKPVSLALHYRQAPRRAAAVAALGRELAAKYGLRRLRGKCLLELIAPGARDKGAAVAALAQSVRAEAILYFGDDRTDESVFALQSVPLLGIYVPPGRGESAPEHGFGPHRWHTRAGYWLNDPRAVVATLAALSRGLPD